MFTVLIFILVISVLVFVHECGHFIMAKRAGMRVDEFGFGFPPRLWSVTHAGTVYSVNLIPFGGFVKVFGEDGDRRSEPGSFGSKPFWARIKVLAAGVAMNFLLAVVLLMIGNFVGLRIGLFAPADIGRARDKEVQIVEVTSGSPAAQGGLRPLDAIVGFKQPDGSVDFGQTPEAIQEYVLAHRGSRVVLEIKRGSDVLDKPFDLRTSAPAGQGPLGISLALTGVVSYPWYESLWRGLHDAVIVTMNTIYGYAALVGTLVTKGKLAGDVSGPIGIATLTGQAARVGFTYLIQFVAMISINLAVLNAVPFPALDGGRAAMLIAERIKGAPLNRRIEHGINAAGFALLITLMIFITVKDVMRFF